MSLSQEFVEYNYYWNLVYIWLVYNIILLNYQFETVYSVNITKVCEDCEDVKLKNK